MGQKYHLGKLTDLISYGVAFYGNGYLAGNIGDLKIPVVSGFSYSLRFSFFSLKSSGAL